MKRNGPLITLLAGLAVAAVLLTLSITAARNARSTNAAQNDTAGAGAAPTTTAASPEGSATAPTAGNAPLAGPVAYAGKVVGGGATLAIAAKDGKAIAYLCDGKKVEAWLQGPAAGGTMSLTGKNGNLTGTYANGVVTGTITAGGKKWEFRVPTVKPPSGLYRATATVRNAKVVAGWIYYNGQQVGIFTTNDGDPTEAPRLDTNSNTANLNGTTLYATPIDGTGL
jgi:hypothetical protein